MGVVFINYRAKDNPIAAAGIHDALARRFGADQVFRDCVSMQAGDDYPLALRDGIERADVLVAVIGPRWHELADKHGTPLIQTDRDWVRWEIARAIERDIPVVPLVLRDLPDSARLPDRSILPRSIERLANFQVFEFSQRRFGADIDRLADRLVELVPSLRAKDKDPPAHVPQPSFGPLDDKADQLAVEVRNRLQHELEQQRILDPDPLPVHWRPLPGESPGSIGTPSGAMDLVSRLVEIAAVHERTKSGWLVVLGRAGSGKSILAMRFALARLAARTYTGHAPVPVIFSLGSWNPGNTTLRGWLIGQLERDQPFLIGTAPNGSTWAAALVGAGYVLPILDGFDEIAVGLRKPALIALNSSMLPLLVTSRREELDDASKETGVKPTATGIELTDLTLDDSVDYLLRATNTTLSDDADMIGWQYVLSELRRHPDKSASANLAAVLTTPLMVTLARYIYESDRDPAELLDGETLNTEAAVEEHILDNFIPTAYSRFLSDDPTAVEHQRWDAEHAQHWLGYLAAHLRQLGTHHIEWWRLGTTMKLRAIMLVVGVTVGLSCALVTGLVYGSEAGFTYGFTGGLRQAIFEGPFSGLGLGLTFGLMHGFATNLKAGGPAFEPSLMQIKFRGGGTRRKLRESFIPRVRAGLAGGLLFGVLWAIGGTVLLAFLGYSWRAIAPASATDLVAGIGVGLLTGVTATIGAGFEAVVAEGERDKVVRPTVLLNRNRTTVLTQMLVVGLVIGSVYGYLFGLANGFGPGLTVGVVAGLMVGLGVGTMTAWGRWVVLARLWLPLTGRLPRHLNTFLRDAYQRGVLRQVGAVYQFRHARLRDRLGTVYRNRPR